MRFADFIKYKKRPKLTARMPAASVTEEQADALNDIATELNVSLSEVQRLAYDFYVVCYRKA
jgi:hypothetical protein